MEDQANIEIVDGVLICAGEWSLRTVSQIRLSLQSIIDQLEDVTECRVHNITQLDTAGALLIQKMLHRATAAAGKLKPQGLSVEYQALYDLLATDAHSLPLLKIYSQRKSILFQIGEQTINKFEHMLLLISFLGEFIVAVIASFRHFRKVKWNDIIVLMEDVGVRAVPIVGLMSFLIGIVLTYQLGIQLKVYGANIFIVKISGISILREFAPLMTAVIMAGRTATSFAALLGAMTINEEVDALRTMGKKPIAHLVLPRVFVMLLVLPLLTAWSDLTCVAGSMIVAKYSLHVDYSIFIEHFQYDVPLIHYFLGFVKVPFFAAIIAGVGCFQGLMSQRNAESVGRQTTKAAVQAIFLIIVADAFFSVLFSWMGV